MISGMPQISEEERRCRAETATFRTANKTVEKTACDLQLSANGMLNIDEPLQGANEVLSYSMWHKRCWLQKKLGS